MSNDTSLPIRGQVQTTPEIDRLTREVDEAQARLAAALKAQRNQPGFGAAVSDYRLRMAGSGSEVKLSELFGGGRDLIVVHNMGRGCVYCTLWADGFNGLYNHLASRTAFVLSTPDDPQAAAAFASGRKWTFPVVSIAGTTFAKDLGFESAKGGVIPGLSAFHKAADGTITRVSRSQQLGPGDPFCPVWPLLDLLKDGPNGWEPKYHY
jgi:predicted dithiol-disulfide oxidoreductase (DUF899 family)